MIAIENAEAWTQVGAFAGLLVAAWWCGPFPHSEPVDVPGLFDPMSKSWHDHSHHAYESDPGLALARDLAAS